MSEGVRARGGWGVNCGHLVSDKKLGILLWKLLLRAKSRAEGLRPPSHSSDELSVWGMTLGIDLILVSVRTS